MEISQAICEYLDKLEQLIDSSADSKVIAKVQEDLDKIYRENFSELYNASESHDPFLFFRELLFTNAFNKTQEEDTSLELLPKNLDAQTKLQANNYINLAKNSSKRENSCLYCFDMQDNNELINKLIKGYSFLVDAHLDEAAYFVLEAILNLDFNNEDKIKKEMVKVAKRLDDHKKLLALYMSMISMDTENVYKDDICKYAKEIGGESYFYEIGLKLAIKLYPEYDLQAFDFLPHYENFIMREGNLEQKLRYYDIASYMYINRRHRVDYEQMEIDKAIRFYNLNANLFEKASFNYKLAYYYANVDKKLSDNYLNNALEYESALLSEYTSKMERLRVYELLKEMYFNKDEEKALEYENKINDEFKSVSQKIAEKK